MHEREKGRRWYADAFIQVPRVGGNDKDENIISICLTKYISYHIPPAKLCSGHAQLARDSVNFFFSTPLRRGFF